MPYHPITAALERTRAFRVHVQGSEPALKETSDQDFNNLLKIYGQNLEDKETKANAQAYRPRTISNILSIASSYEPNIDQAKLDILAVVAAEYIYDVYAEFTKDGGPGEEKFSIFRESFLADLPNTIDKNRVKKRLDALIDNDGSLCKKEDYDETYAEVSLKQLVAKLQTPDDLPSDEALANAMIGYALDRDSGDINPKKLAHFFDEIIRIHRIEQESDENDDTEGDKKKVVLGTLVSDDDKSNAKKRAFSALQKLHDDHPEFLSSPAIFNYCANNAGYLQNMHAIDRSKKKAMWFKASVFVPIALYVALAGYISAIPSFFTGLRNFLETSISFAGIWDMPSYLNMFSSALLIPTFIGMGIGLVGVIIEKIGANINIPYVGAGIENFGKFLKIIGGIIAMAFALPIIMGTLAAAPLWLPITVLVVAPVLFLAGKAGLFNLDKKLISDKTIQEMKANGTPMVGKLEKMNPTLGGFLKKAGMFGAFLLAAVLISNPFTAVALVVALAPAAVAYGAYKEHQEIKQNLEAQGKGLTPEQRESIELTEFKPNGNGPEPTLSEPGPAFDNSKASRAARSGAAPAIKK